MCVCRVSLCKLSTPERVPSTVLMRVINTESSGAAEAAAVWVGRQQLACTTAATLCQGVGVCQQQPVSTCLSLVHDEQSRSAADAATNELQCRHVASVTLTRRSRPPCPRAASNALLAAAQQHRCVDRPPALPACLPADATVTECSTGAFRKRSQLCRLDTLAAVNSQDVGPRDGPDVRRPFRQ